MRTLEELFIREFKDNIRVLGNKDIYSIPLPSECKLWEVSGTEEYRVQGIEDEYYGLLNDKVVRRLPKGTIAKRRVIDKATRGYKKNENGEYEYQDYPIPSGSMVVLSHVNIGLPYSRYVKDVDGYGYIDFTKDKDGSVLYMYVIPKDFLYKINQTALAMSVKNMKNYSGIGLTTWDSGIIFLHVIPYNPNSSYVGTKILKTGKTVDYTAEIHTITDFWQKKGIIPEIRLCALQDDTNLCLKPTVTGYDYYEPVDISPVGYRETFGEEANSAEE